MIVSVIRLLPSHKPHVRYPGPPSSMCCRAALFLHMKKAVHTASVVSVIDWGIFHWTLQCKTWDVGPPSLLYAVVNDLPLFNLNVQPSEHAKFLSLPVPLSSPSSVTPSPNQTALQSAITQTKTPLVSMPLKHRSIFQSKGKLLFPAIKHSAKRNN